MIEILSELISCHILESHVTGSESKIDSSSRSVPLLSDNHFGFSLFARHIALVVFFSVEEYHQVSVLFNRS